MSLPLQAWLTCGRGSMGPFAQGDWVDRSSLRGLRERPTPPTDSGSSRFHRFHAFLRCAFVLHIQLNTSLSSSLPTTHPLLSTSSIRRSRLVRNIAIYRLIGDITCTGPGPLPTSSSCRSFASYDIINGRPLQGSPFLIADHTRGDSEGPRHSCEALPFAHPGRSRSTVARVLMHNSSTPRHS